MRPANGYAAKRLFDFVISLAALLVLMPLLLIVAAAVKLTSRGPALFLQKRSGQVGREFAVIKFRTMTLGAAPVAGVETQVDDPRITRLGAWLRRSGIDELPQLFNVLAGQMSIVGPRPLLKWENDSCDDRQRARLNVRPGLTGLSQVHGRNNILWAERVEWDLQYVQTVSLRLDVYICFKTIPVMIFGQNAYLRPPETEAVASSSPQPDRVWDESATVSVSA